MHSYASLLAKEITFASYLKLGLTVECPVPYLYKVSLAGKMIDTVDGNNYTPTELLEATRFERYYDFVEIMLNRPRVDKKDPNIRAAAYILYNWLDKFIAQERLKSNILYLTVGARNHAIHVDEFNPSQNHCSLALTKLIVEGVKFTEYPGSHFISTDLDGPQHVTTTTKCNCTDFLDYNLCDHVLSVKSIMANKKLCREHKVFNTL